MRFFIESGDPAEIRTALAWGERMMIAGALVGAAVNPAALREIAQLVAGPVLVTAGEAAVDELLTTVRALGALGPNVVVLLPANADGLAALPAARGEGLAVGLFGCTALTEALRAAQAGARFLVPAGERFEAGGDGIDLVRKIGAHLQAHRLAAEVVVPAGRGPNQIVEAALVGATIAAAPRAVLAGLLERQSPALGDEALQK